MRLRGEILPKFVVWRRHESLFYAALLEVNGESLLARYEIVFDFAAKTARLFPPAPRSVLALQRHSAVDMRRGRRHVQVVVLTCELLLLLVCVAHNVPL